MKTNLYIDDQLCSSFAELEQYFLELSSDSNAYHDLLDYSRHGDLIAWLKEQNEIELADRICLIDQSLGDSEYMNQILAVFVSSENNITRFHKPEFSRCVNLSISNKNLTQNTLSVEISLEILLAVNECYEVIVKTEWGNKGFTINPSKYIESHTYKTSYTFNKRPGTEIERLLIYVDGYILHDEPFNNIPKTNTSQQLETIEGDQSPNERLTTTIQHIANTLIGVIQEAEIKRKEGVDDVIHEPPHSQGNRESINISQPANKKYSWQTPGYYAAIEKDRKEREERERLIRERQLQKEREEQAEADRISLEKWKRRHGIK
jgi:hypothetical protein